MPKCKHTHTHRKKSRKREDTHVDINLARKALVYRTVETKQTPVCNSQMTTVLTMNYLPLTQREHHTEQCVLMSVFL